MEEIASENGVASFREPASIERSWTVKRLMVLTIPAVGYFVAAKIRIAVGQHQSQRNPCLGAGRHCSGGWPFLRSVGLAGNFCRGLFRSLPPPAPPPPR
jgi:hypothetical protein